MLLARGFPALGAQKAVKAVKAQEAQLLVAQGVALRDLLQPLAPPQLTALA